MMRGIYDVVDYGAKGDNSVNDLAALQAATDAADAAGGGTVWLGPGTFNIGTGTWKIGQAKTQHHINVEGINPIATRILCDTSDGHAAIYLNFEKYVTIKELGVINQGARGGYGMQLGGDNGSGTQTSGSLLQHLFFQNFAVGISTSGGIGTSSEIECAHCIFQGNDYGFTTANFNALNFLFQMVEMYDNAKAGMSIALGNVTVIGGASHNNVSDFIIPGGNDSTVKIAGFRAELPTDTWLIADSNSYLSLEDCLVHPRQAGAEVIRTAGELRATNCIFRGQITSGVAPSAGVTLEHVWVNTPGTDWIGNNFSTASPPFGPGFRVKTTAVQNPQPKPFGRVYIRDVYEGSTGAMYEDVQGSFIFNAGGATGAVI
jgi:hypothetical protein